MDRDLLKALRGLQPDVEGLLQDHKAFCDKHAQELLARCPLTDDFNTAMWRLRNYAGEVIKRWAPGRNAIDGFLELTVVDTHDAAVDAVASMVSGGGAPSVALLRRLYELGTLLIAGWQDPSGLQIEMEHALQNKRRDDYYVGLARRGVIGAVMPSPARIRRLWTEDDSLLKEIEKGIQSMGHGGLLAGVFYLAPSHEAQFAGRLEHSIQFSSFVQGLVAATSGAAWQILERLHYPSTYRGADRRFDPSKVDAAEDGVMDQFDQAFPAAFEVIWSVLLGMTSLSIHLSDATGSRGYDPIRRQVQLVHECFETGCMAVEFLHRGRLAGSGTLIRRLFELSLEIQAWVRFPEKMTARFTDPVQRERTPSARSLIAWLHGPKDSSNQRRTYSILCSVAHGGLQSHEYLLEGDLKTGLRVQPAPIFAYRHHRWLLGTLISTLDAALGGTLVLAQGIDSSIFENHAGYLDLVRGYTRDTPELGLIRYEEV